MSTQNETCINVVAPPGNSNKIKNLQLFGSGSTIQFEKNRPSTPLPPLVQATFITGNGESEKGTLEVCAFVFLSQSAIDSLETNPLTVNWDGNELEPNFYITYNSIDQATNFFHQYKVQFNITFDKKPSKINTVVWDKDPETSRGTVTTVQP